MSTSYEWTDAPCSHCGHATTLHICNTASLWKPFIQAHKEPEIRSWWAWKRLLRKHGSIIRDECGQRWDAEEFIVRIEEWQASSETRHYLQVYESDGFFDFDGYMLLGREFS